MARFVRQRADLSRRAAEEGSEQRLREAEESWQALKAALLEYRKNPTSGNRRILLERSEDSWRKADAVVLAAQQLTEYKVAGIRLLYLGIALNVITALVVLLVVYVYVRKRIEYQATHDTLTRLLNRHSFEQELSMEINRSRRYNHPFSLILLDIDHFKRINDRFGHKAGDQVLAATGGLVKGLMRKSDQVFRIGGEEFAIVASETAGENGVRLAEKVRQEVEKYDFGTGERVTVSLGVAQWGRETDADLFRNADRALYRAKEGGRNQTRLFSWVDHAAPG
jgi:diguanylate cyclase (GGDEF)-like protein